MIVLLLVVVMFGFRTTEYVLTSAYVEDALAASNLASAVIDLEEYGRTHTILVKDPQSAFLLYKEALCYNLQLDEYLNTTNREVIAGKVSILDYIIYNVSGENISIYSLDEEGVLRGMWTCKPGEAITPDGVLVESTTIYSRVAFSVKSLGERTYEATKEKSIDIVRCESE